MTETTPDLLFSESVEMYLLRIALLSQQESPVPISALAEELGISPVSTNQMCRKLEEHELIIYQPYKGVALTANGEQIANKILEKRRLWARFLKDALGMDHEEAETYACRFEHVTPDEVSESLALFLNSYGANKPALLAGSKALRTTLDALPVGQMAEVVAVDAPKPLLSFLTTEGIFPGTRLKVLAVSSQGVYLVDIDHHQLALAAELAARVHVAPLS